MKPNDTTPFTDEERRLVARAINHCGTGAHPYATAENVEHFTRSYAAECVQAAMVAMTPLGQAVAVAALRKL